VSTIEKGVRNAMGLELRGRFIFFATSNVNKFNEARQILTDYRITVGMLRVRTLEVQSDDLAEIAKIGVLETFEKCSLPIIVEDAGLFIDSLNGFPGPYAAYVCEKIGNQGLLRLMEKKRNRKAAFRSAIAYYSSDLKSPLCFEGQVMGEIARQEQRRNRTSGFGFDPIFRPSNSRKAFAEMTIKEKNRYSHRARALGAFARWFRALGG